jgi:hypothetical protein
LLVSIPVEVRQVVLHEYLVVAEVIVVHVGVWRRYMVPGR